MAAQPGDDFLAGIDPVSAFRADVEAEVAVEVERQMIGDVSNWKPEGLTAVMPRLQSARFRAKVYAYHHGRWLWAYEITMDAPWATKVVAGRAQFDSQPGALAAAFATLRNMPASSGA